MPKRKIDKKQLIPDDQNRQVSFCKKKKELLRKAMELSSMCGQRFLMMMYDEKSHRMVYYTSEDDFTLESAYRAKKKAKEPENVKLFERFTNRDYDDICSKDFRAVRYKKQQKYQEAEPESEEQFFEGLLKKRTAREPSLSSESSQSVSPTPANKSKKKNTLEPPSKKAALENFTQMSFSSKVGQVLEETTQREAPKVQPQTPNPDPESRRKSVRIFLANTSQNEGITPRNLRSTTPRTIQLNNTPKAILMNNNPSFGRPSVGNGEVPEEPSRQIMMGAANGQSGRKSTHAVRRSTKMNGNIPLHLIQEQMTDGDALTRKGLDSRRRISQLLTPMNGFTHYSDMDEIYQKLQN